MDLPRFNLSPYDEAPVEFITIPQVETAWATLIDDLWNQRMQTPEDRMKLYRS